MVTYFPDSRVPKMSRLAQSIDYDACWNTIYHTAKAPAAV